MKYIYILLIFTGCSSIQPQQHKHTYVIFTEAGGYDYVMMK